MAEQESAFAIAEMHAVTLTVTEILTFGTFTIPHPFTMTVGRIAVLPHLHEVILINIPLVIVGTDTGTGSDGAVGHHRAHRHTSLTGEEATARLTLVVAEEALTAIVCLDAPLFANHLDEIKHPTEFPVGQPHHRIRGCPTDREDGEESPALHPL